MKKTVAFLLILALLSVGGASLAEASGSMLDFPRSGISWQLPDAVKNLPGGIVYITDPGESKDSGGILAEVYYTGLSEEQALAMNEKITALLAEGNPEEAAALAAAEAEATPLLALFFGVRDGASSPDAMLGSAGKDGSAVSCRAPVEIGKQGDYTYWLSVPAPDSAGMIHAANQLPAAELDILAHAMDEIMANPSLAALTGPKTAAEAAVSSAIASPFPGPDSNAAYAEIRSWTLRVTDQYGNPVPDVAVSFCTQFACIPVELDANGIGTYRAPADSYHIAWADMPEGYSADHIGDLYTGWHSGVISVVLTKEEEVSPSGH